MGACRKWLKEKSDSRRAKPRGSLNSAKSAIVGSKWVRGGFRTDNHTYLAHALKSAIVRSKWVRGGFWTDNHTYCAHALLAGGRGRARVRPG